MIRMQASDNMDRPVSAVRRMLRRSPGHLAARSQSDPEAGPPAIARPRSDAARPVFGIVTALPAEFAAMRSLIDDPRRVTVDGDRADYVLGTVPSLTAGQPHQVVLTLLGDMGNDAAAGAGANLVRSFPSVRCLLVVGTAAGVPNLSRPDRHVRLGDVVVARRGIVEYDSVRDKDSGTVPRRTFPPPSPQLERCARMLEAGEVIDTRPWEDLLAAQVQVMPGFGRPAETTDILHSADDSHAQTRTLTWN